MRIFKVKCRYNINEIGHSDSSTEVAAVSRKSKSESSYLDCLAD